MGRDCPLPPPSLPVRTQRIGSGANRPRRVRAVFAQPDAEQVRGQHTRVVDEPDGSARTLGTHLDEAHELKTAVFVTCGIQLHPFET